MILTLCSRSRQPASDRQSASALTSLAAKLRCTLGGLYLDIGEDAAAVAELSRAVLLAKRSQQADVYVRARGAAARRVLPDERRRNRARLRQLGAEEGARALSFDS